MLKHADFVTYLAENEGQAEDYLCKVDTQWQASHAEAYGQIKRNEPVTALLECIHYALIMTAVNNLRVEIDDDYEEQYYAITSMLTADTPQLDTLKTYLYEQVLPKTNPFNQAMAYIQLASETTDHAEQENLCKQTEAMLPFIQDNYQKASAFYQYVATFNLLNINNQWAELEAQFEAVPDPWQQAHLYSQLARFDKYPKQEWALQLALEKALQIDDPYFKVTTLSSFVQQLSLTDDVKANFRAEMQATVPLIKSVRPRLQAMYHIYQFATPAEQQQIAEEVLYALQHNLPTEYAQLGVIQYYGRVFEGKNRTKLMAIARKFDNQMYRARGLAVFLPDIETSDMQIIQRDVLDYLVHLSTRSRSQTLSLFMRRELFSPHIWGEAVVQQIAQIIAETCADWGVQA